MNRYTIGPPIEATTHQAFYEYVRSLRIQPAAKPESKAAPGIKLSNTKKAGLRILSTREQKLVTLNEIDALALEYTMDSELLYKTFNERKWSITDQQGAVTNVKPKRTRTRQPAKAASQGDAHLAQNRITSESADKLF